MPSFIHEKIYEDRLAKTSQIEHSKSDVTRNIKFCVYKEVPYYVAQCLNVDVSSFGDTIEEAIANLKEAVALYYEDELQTEYQPIEEVLVGESLVNA